ncbi:MAG: MlaD family protein [bacterium]
MKKYSMETVVGIFMLAGLICVGYLTVKLGNLSIFGDNSYAIFARFNSISGLRIGSPVEMLGIEIGQVDSFSMDQDKMLRISL